MLFHIYVCTNGGLQGLCETADKYDDFKIIESGES